MERACAGLLALRAAAGRLALAGGDAAADARARLAATRRRAQVMELHWLASSEVLVRDLLGGHQEAHGADHAARRGVVAMLDGVADAVQAEGADRPRARCGVLTVLLRRVTRSLPGIGALLATAASAGR